MMQILRQTDLRMRARDLANRGAWLGRRILSERAGNELIAEIVRSGQPAAIGKLGSVELEAVRRYRASGEKAREAPVDWSDLSEALHVNAGVYPPTPSTFARFSRVYADALTSLDVLGVWFRRGEASVAREHAPQAVPVRLRSLESFYHASPWTRHLEDKRVVVVTPFAATVEAQYARREEVWPHNPAILPRMELRTLRVPFSAGIAPAAFPDWFAALDSLCARLEEMQFDVALIGAGAWSIPLATHAKRLGRCGIHVGGGTQVLFGIKGARWDDHPVVSRFYNHAWRRPDESERPPGFRAVEHGCYW